MPNEKSPGNDGLTKEFFATFQPKVKRPFLQCILHSFSEEELCTSQGQAIIKLIEKKDNDKRLIQNWRRISLLNIDAKIFPKLYQNVSRMFFRHLSHIINLFMLMKDSLVKVDA